MKWNLKMMLALFCVLCASVATKQTAATAANISAANTNQINLEVWQRQPSETAPPETLEELIEQLLGPEIECGDQPKADPSLPYEFEDCFGQIKTWDGML